MTNVMLGKLDQNFPNTFKSCGADMQETWVFSRRGGCSVAAKSMELYCELNKCAEIQLEVPAVEHQEAIETVHSTLPVFSLVKWCNTCQILQRCSKYKVFFVKHVDIW